MEAQPEHVNPFASPLAEEVNRPSGGSDDLSLAEATRRQHLNREASIKSIGLLYLIPAVIGAIGTVMAFGVAVLAAGTQGMSEAGLLAVLTAVYGGFTALFWWIGTGLRRLNPAVRTPTIVLSAIGLLGFPLGTLINGYILWLVASETGAYVMSDEYKQVIAATPHIRYKTSIVIWILLGLLILLVLVGVIAAISSGA